MDDIPATFPSRDVVFAPIASDTWVNPGDSVIVRPGGKVEAGPLHEEHGIVYADLDVARVASDHRTLDVVGHYARNDIFQLTIDRSAARLVTITVRLVAVRRRSLMTGAASATCSKLSRTNRRRRSRSHSDRVSAMGRAPAGLVNSGGDHLNALTFTCTFTCSHVNSANF